MLQKIASAQLTKETLEESNRSMVHEISSLKSLLDEREEEFVALQQNYLTLRDEVDESKNELKQVLVREAKANEQLNEAAKVIILSIRYWWHRNGTLD